MEGTFISEQATLTQHEATLRLRILATTDLHANIWPVSYLAAEPRPRIGLAALSQTIAAARAEAPFSLLFDNGDFLQGTPLADCAAEEIIQNPTFRHPMIAAMNALGYDAGTLGNHDFNYGLNMLGRCLSQTEFPFVCTNIRNRDLSAQPLVPRYAILQRDVPDESGTLRPLQIGVIGATPPQTIQWEQNQLGDRLVARDIIYAVREAVADIRAQGADLVVVLSHSGIGSSKPPMGSENVSLALGAIEGVDIVVAGHSHQLFPGPDIVERAGLDTPAGKFNGTPAVLPGALGSHLGVIDMTLAGRDGTWRVSAAHSSLRPCTPLSLDRPEAATGMPALILKLTESAHHATETASERPMGSTELRLHGYFAPVTQSGAQDLVADALRWRARQLLESSGAEDRPLFVATCPFSAGGRAGPFAFPDVPAGQLALRHLTRLSPFPNQLCVKSITGQILRAWIERSVSGFRTLTPGTHNGALIDARAACYNFDTLHGPRYEIDLSRDALFSPTGNAEKTSGKGRVRTLTWAGKPVQDTDRVYVATNSYRASGGGGYGMLEGAPDVICGTGPLRDEISSYVQEVGVISALPDPSWTFTPLQATALFNSHPNAQNTDLPKSAPPMRRIGLLDTGFSQFEVTI